MDVIQSTLEISAPSMRKLQGMNPGRRGGGVALYIREALDAMQIEINDDSAECLWVTIRGKANKADILVGVC